MSFKNVYYQIERYGRHIRASLPRPDSKVYKIGTYSDATGVVVKTGGQKDWPKTLENADLIDPHMGFISSRFKEAIEEYYEPVDVQFIPLIILHKNQPYKDFFILNPLLKMNLIDPLKSHWWADRLSIISYYGDDTLEVFREKYPNIHFVLDPLCVGIYVSDEMRKLINRKKLKLRVQKLEDNPMTFKNPTENDILGKDMDESIWKGKVKEAINYEFLKEKFGWE